MFVSSIDFSSLGALQHARDHAESPELRMQLASRIDKTRWQLVQLRNGIEVSESSMPTGMHALASAHFSHYQLIEARTALGHLQNRLNTDETFTGRELTLMLQRVNQTIPGFSIKVLEQFERDNEHRIIQQDNAQLRVAIEETLILHFRQLTPEQQGQIYGEIHQNRTQETFGLLLWRKPPSRSLGTLLRPSTKRSHC